jgi:hypothetical protein
MGISQALAGSYRVPTIQYITLSNITLGQTTYNFTNVNIGGPGLIVVGAHAEAAATAARSITTFNINGTAATDAGTRAQGGTTSVISSVRTRVITSGTTANVSITFNLGMARCRIGIWRILEYNSETSAAGNTASATSGTSLSTTVSSIPFGSVGVVIQTNGTNDTPMTWTNATERYDSIIGTGTTTQASGADFTITTPGSRTISTSHTNSAQPITLVAATWR